MLDCFQGLTITAPGGGHRPSRSKSNAGRDHCAAPSVSRWSWRPPYRPENLQLLNQVTAYSAARPPSTNTLALPPYPCCVLRFCNSVTSPPVSSVSDTAAETAIDGDPKSRAGARTVAFPADIVPELADHLERFADPKPNGFVFIGPKGGRLRRSNFREVWNRARGAVGLPELHFHDLRHTGTRWRPRRAPASRS